MNTFFWGPWASGALLGVRGAGWAGWGWGGSTGLRAISFGGVGGGGVIDLARRLL